MLRYRRTMHRKARKVDPRELDRLSLISRANAVQLIAQETKKSVDEDDRTVRSRVSKALTRAIEKGQLQPPSPQGFIFGKLANWARMRWPGKFTDWKVFSTKVSSDLTVTWDSPDIPDSGSLSVEEADCLRATLARYKQENATLKQRIEGARRKRSDSAKRAWGKIRDK